MQIRRIAPIGSAVLAAAAVLTWIPSDQPSSEATRIAGIMPAGTGSTTSGRPSGPLIPATARLDRVADLVRDPERDHISDDPKVREQVRLGYRIVRQTRKYAGRYVGNDLDCSNCHLNAGQRELALPLVGIAGAFPQFRSRENREITLEERIIGCFRRSHNGTAPPSGSPELSAVIAYIGWLSEGHPADGQVPWREKNRIPKEKQLPLGKLDVNLGAKLYWRHCTNCHGADGQGKDLAIARPGPLWGGRSWNDGAGTSRIYTLAGYIRFAMPLLNPGVLTDEEAQHIAAFIDAHDRPVFPEKHADYPAGDIPKDAVYYPIYPKNPLPEPVDLTAMLAEK